jgi:hypothetical protein
VAQFCLDEKHTLHAELGSSEESEITMALTVVALHFETQAKWHDWSAHFPHVIDRSSKERGDDEVRVMVRVLAAATHGLFGQFLYETLATVATVATVALERSVTGKQVEKWCAGLRQQPMNRYLARGSQ